MRKNGARGSLPEFRRSLLSRYMLIIATAVMFLPVILSLNIILVTLLGQLTEMRLDERAKGEMALYGEVPALGSRWHEEARRLTGRSSRDIDTRLKELGEHYQYASMFWVDGDGITRLSLPARKKIDGGAADKETPLPATWTASSAVAFMKESVNSDPLTVVAFIGDRPDAGEGFMAISVPKSVLRRNTVDTLPNLWYVLVLLALFIGFAAVSWLFFARIRRRLLRLQTAMALNGRDGLPAAIPKGKPDEIGMLEEAFNTMVAEIKGSRRREREEEELRKRLIADLSHDLRTPLTVVRSHLFQVGKEPLSPQGKESLDLMDERIADLDALIDNLLNYNLLASGRVKLSPERKNVLRLLRESAASWYPLWSKEGMEVDIQLEVAPLYWEIDEIWFRRVLDNLYQNVVRHAKDGGYVGISAEERGGVRAVVIRDRGRGIGEDSKGKGAGLGLAIVDMLLARMGLAWQADSGLDGTAIFIYPILNKT